ncbi:MAG: type I restriction endonuclease subunit R, partial [Blastocatellia bacterium]|nr:type I restriction endonuclease subunit R [Blastocatellia bacterium]
LMARFPAILEDQISQIPALQLLQNLGYHYLRPEEAVLERRGALANVLLEGILAKQLRRLNRITYKGRQYEFSERNIQAAIAALRDVPIDGMIHTSEKVYDLLSLGKSLEQMIGKDTRSFTLNYIDWTNPENNLFHVAEEFEVEGAGGRQTWRPGIVLFVNGIPFAVIECGRPDETAAKDSLNLAIFRQLRNQKYEYIPQLFLYSQLLLAVNNQRARYGTVGTRKEFWSCWREEDTEEVTRAVGRFINKPLSREQKERLFGGRFAYLRQYFDDLEIEERPANEQDIMIYCLCRPERLLELARQFVVFDAGEKKIARSHQYFAVKKTLARIKRMGIEGRRMGGVIWHTQGSGKSLALIMMAKAIALDSAIPDPRIVLVTDRIDLAEQIWGTFRSCGREPVQARTGRHLLELLAGRKATIITAVIDKFETAVRSQGQQNPANNIFFLVDESHRGQYGEVILKMQKLLPNACYIGFTGTPLKKVAKETALKLGGIIDAYTSSRAIRDEVLVPLLYERRKVGGISEIAGDISEHFCKNWQGTPFKAQLIADSRLSALSLKKHLDVFGKVSSEVLISSPDVGEEGGAEIQSFWARIMEKYGSEKEYNRSVINAFKNGERPEIIIVVDKLLDGFDVPRNTVLYLARRLEDHSLLKAIARVNRPYPGKDFGYVIDYCGLAAEAGAAPGASGALAPFDEADLQELLWDLGEEAAKLPERRAELWGLFEEIQRDEEKFERLLADNDRRE